MKCINYYRVSTKLQEHKYSLKAQKEELTQYATSQGWEIVAEFTDVDSGGKLDKPGLNSVFDLVEEGHVDVVLVINQDRLSRLDTIAWEYLKSTLRENDVKIAEPGTIVDLADEDQEFFSDIKNLIAKREKRSIVRKMMYGKRQRTREGKGWGMVPFEYDYDKNTGSYSLNKDYSWVIPFIDDLYINKGKSYKQIAKALNEIKKTPNGKLWTETNVHNRMTSKIYHGIMEKSFSNGETITVEDVYPKLRTEKQFEKIKELRKRRFRKKPGVLPQLLRHTELTCGICGRKLSITMSGTKQYGLHFYITHGRPVRIKDQTKCEMSINTIRVDQNIIKAVKDIISSEDLARKHVKMDYDESDLAQIMKEAKAAKKLVAEAQEKLDMLLPLYLDKKFKKEQLDKQHELLTKEVEVQEERYKQLEAKYKLIKSNMFNYDAILQYMVVAERFDVLLTGDEQMEMIGTLFPAGTVYEDCIILNGTLGGNVPLEINIAVDPNPFEGRYVNYDRNRDPQGKYEKIQELIKNNPGMSQRQIAEKLDISPASITRLKNKYGEFEEHVKAIEHDPEKKKDILVEYMKNNPGASLRQTARDTGISTTHIRRLKAKYSLD